MSYPNPPSKFDRIILLVVLLVLLIAVVSVGSDSLSSLPMNNPMVEGHGGYTIGGVLIIIALLFLSL